MEDIYANDIMCKECHKKTAKGHLVKDGFTIRTWECKGCDKVWHHPLDANEYLKFAKLKRKNFKVKLRKVGNSFTATIPQEIVEFGGIPKAGKTIKMHMEAANKVALMLK